MGDSRQEIREKIAQRYNEERNRSSSGQGTNRQQIRAQIANRYYAERSSYLPEIQSNNTFSGNASKTRTKLRIDDALEKLKQGENTLDEQYVLAGNKEKDPFYYEQKAQYYEKRIQELKNELPKYDFNQNWSSEPIKEVDPQSERNTSVELNQIQEEYKKFKYEQKAGKARSQLHKDYDENQDGSVNLQDVFKAQSNGDTGRDIQRSLVDGLDMQQRVKQIYDAENGNYNINDEAGRPLDPATFPADEDEKRSAYEKLVEEKKQKSERLKGQLTADGYDVDALLDVYKREENARRREREKKSTEKFAEEHPVESSVGSILATPAAALGIFESIPRGLKELITGEYDPVDPNSPFFSGVQLKNDIRGKVSENMEGWQSFLYQTGMSMGDFLSLLPLGEVGSLAIMGSGAASDASLKVAENGGSATQSMLTGVAAGVAEVLFEKISLEQLQVFRKTDKTGLKEAVKNIAKGFFTEGSEEVATDIANLVSDAVINSDNSEFSRAEKQYEENGMSSDAAWKQTILDTITNMGLDFLGGALSGAVMSAGATSLNAISTARLGAHIKNGETSFDLEDVIDAGKTTDFKSRAYQIADRLIKNQEQQKKIGNYQVGALYRENLMNHANYDDALLGSWLSPVQDELINQGITSGESTQAYQLASQLQEKQQNKERITNKERARLQQAVAAAEQMDIKRKAELENDPAAFQKRLQEMKNEPKNAAYASNADKGEVALSETENASTPPQKRRSGTKTKNNTGTITTTVMYDDKIQYIQEIADTKNGTVKVILNSGKTVNLDRVAVASEETRAVYSIAAHYDKNGANTFVDRYNGKLSPEHYADSFDAFYLAGKQGRSFEGAVQRLPAIVELLGTDDLQAAYHAGIRDQAEAVKVRQENVRRNNKNKPEQKGSLTVDIRDKKSLSDDAKAQIRLLQALTERYGVNVKVVDSKTEMNDKVTTIANGIYRGNGNIVVDIRADAGAVAAVAFHEVGHYINEKNPEGFQDLSDFAVSYLEKQSGYDMDERIAQLQQLTKEQTGKWISEEDALEEIVCNSLSSIASEPDAIDAALQLTAKKRRSLIEVLKDFAERLKEIFSDFSTGNKEAARWKGSYENIMELARLLERKADTAKESSANSQEDIKYSIKNTRGLDWQTQLDRYFSGNLKSSDSLYLGDTPAYLESIGIDSAPLYMPTGVITKGMRLKDDQSSKSAHELSKDCFYELLTGLENPVALIHNPEKQSIIYITDTVFQNNPLVLSARTNCDLYGEVAHKVTSVYPRENISAFLSNLPEDASIFINKEKADKLLSKAGLQLPARQTIYDLISNTGESGNLPPGAGKSYPGLLANTESTNSIEFENDSVKMDTEIKKLKYSLRETGDTDYTAAAQEDEKIKSVNSILIQMIKETGSKQANIEALRKAGRKILKEYSSSYDLDMFVDNFQKIFDYIANNENADYQGAIQLCTDVAKAVIEKSSSLDTSMSEAYSEFRNEMKIKRISLSDEQKQELAYAYGSYRTGRNKLMGKTIITNDGISLDSLWSELSVKYPELFEYDTQETEQPFRLIEIFDAMQPQMKNQFEGYIDEAATELAYRLYDEYFAVPEVKTEAQKQNNRLLALRAQYNDALSDIKRSYKQRYQTAVKELEQEYRQKNTERSKETARAVLEAKAQTKAYYQDMALKTREQAKAAETRRKLKRIYEHMQRRLMKPTDTSYVPKELVKPVCNMLKMVGAINGKSTATYAELKASLDVLQDEYQKYSRGLGIDEDGTESALNYHYEENEQFAKTIDDLVHYYARLVSQKTDRGLLKLTSGELQDIYHVMTELDHILSTANKLVGRDKAMYVHDVANHVISEITTSNDKVARQVKGYFLSSLAPIRAAKLMTGYKENSEFVRLFEDLDRGQGKELRIQQEADDIFRDIYNKYLHLTKDGEKIGTIKNKGDDFKRKTALDTFSGKKAELVDVGLFDEEGNSVLITPAMRLAFLLHLENRDNFYHIMNGGLTVPDMKLYAKGEVVDAFNPGISIKGMSAEKLLQIMNRIHEEMSDMEREMYTASKYFFNTFSKNYINDTSLQLNGYKKAMVKDYFPIVTDKAYLNKDFDVLKYDYSIENAGSLHNRIRGAKTPVLLEEVTNVIDRQTRFVSKYAGLAIPLRNFKAVYNATGKSFSGSVKKVMQQNWGAAKSKEAANSNVFKMSGEQYIINLISDLQVPRKGDSFLSRMTSNYAGAVLTLNPGVTIKQAASYPTAAAVLGWKAVNKALIKGGKNKSLISRADVELINKYTPYFWYRTKGYSIRELGDLKANDKGWANNRNLQALTGWIQAVDLATVGRIWTAAEYYVDEHYTKLEKGTDIYYKEVASWFEKAVKETQPNYTVMQRPDFMRDRGMLSKVFTMFKTVPLQNFGAIVDAVGEYRARRIDFNNSRTIENQAKVKKSFHRLCNVASSQVVSAAVLALMTLVGNMLLHRPEYYEDENGELTAGSILTQYGKDTFSALASEPLFGSEICSWFLQSDPYDIDLAAISTLNKLYTGGAKARETIAGLLAGEKSWEDVQESLDFFVTSAFEVFGLPAGNSKKILNAVMMYGEDIQNGELFTAGRKQTQAQVGNLLYQATVDGDHEKYEYYVMELKDRNKTENQINTIVTHALSKNDPRIRTAALAMQSGNMAEMNRIIAELAAAGFSRQTVVAAIQYYYNKKLKEN